MLEKNGVCSGNAMEDGRDTRGWFVGEFIPKGCLLHQANIEIKIGTYKRDDERSVEDATSDPQRVSIAILISGKATFYFPNRKVFLQAPGDYVIWDKKILHWWNIVEDDTVIQTIRWKPQAS